MAGCAHAPPTVRDCRATSNVSLIGSREELNECAGIQNSVAREGCYDNEAPPVRKLLQPQHSWVLVLPAVLGTDHNATASVNVAPQLHVSRNASL